MPKPPDTTTFQNSLQSSSKTSNHSFSIILHILFTSLIFPCLLENSSYCRDSEKIEKSPQTKNTSSYLFISNDVYIFEKIILYRMKKHVITRDKQHAFRIEYSNKSTCLWLGGLYAIHIKHKMCMYVVGALIMSLPTKYSSWNRYCTFMKCKHGLYFGCLLHLKEDLIHNYQVYFIWYYNLTTY